MRIRISLVLGLLCLPQIAWAKLQVVTTTPDLAAIVEDVGGGRVAVVNLVQPGEDPHYLDPRPSLAVKLARADLLVLVGLDLEVGWLPSLVQASRNGNIQPGKAGYLDTSTAVEVLDVPQGKVDRSMGDIHPGGNPHFQYEPASMLRVASVVAERLGELDPGNRMRYLENLKLLQGAIAKFLQQQQPRIDRLQGLQVVSYHSSLSYLARWLGLQIVDVVEPRPGVKPSPRHVVALIEKAQAGSLQLVLQEDWYPTRTSQLVASKASIPFVLLPGGSEPIAGGYVHFLTQILQQLAGATKP